jgi:hypothetical protein
MPKDVRSFNNDQESLEIDHHSDYTIEVSTDFKGLPDTITKKYPGLPEEYYGKKITWIFRFGFKGNPASTNKKFQVKLSKFKDDRKYVLYLEGDKIILLEHGVPKDLTVGDPAVGISN